MGGALEDWENLSSKLAILKQFDANGQLRIECLLTSPSYRPVY